MRRAVELEKLWADAGRLAAADLVDDGHEPPPLPPNCPFALEELVSGGVEPRELASRLAAAVAALRPAAKP